MSSYRPSSMYSSMLLRAGKLNILNLQITQLKSRKSFEPKNPSWLLEVPCCPPPTYPLKADGWKMKKIILNMAPFQRTRIHPWSPQEADVDGEAPEAPPPEAPDAKRLAAAAAAARRRGNPTKVGWLGRVRMIKVRMIIVSKNIKYICYLLMEVYFLKNKLYTKNNRCKCN